MFQVIKDNGSLNVLVANKKYFIIERLDMYNSSCIHLTHLIIGISIVMAFG